MLPTGHAAAGVLLGHRRSRRSAWPRSASVLAAVCAAVLPDADMAIPPLLDAAGIEHGLESGRHHSWATHTPLFWAGVISLVRHTGRGRRAPRWAPEAADILMLGVTLHLMQDAVANTVALLWPLRRREYGLGLDRLAGVTDHAEYTRRYPRTPAGAIEAALVAAAVWTLGSDHRRVRSAPSSSSSS